MTTALAVRSTTLLPGGRCRLGAALLIAVAGAAVALPSASLAQTARVRVAASDTVPNGCPATPKPVPPPDARRREARDLAARAQEAAIVADNATSRDLYQRAAKLDPTDAPTAYALGRAYESAKDPRAVTEYCRFLALAPGAAEAADVRQRVAALSFNLVSRNQPAGVSAVRSEPLPSAGAAFTLGVFFPGLGQYYTHQPAGGLLVTAAAAGALYFAMQSETVNTQVTRTATDPNGNPYQYQELVSRSERPNAAIGVAAAAGISLIGAIAAYAHARGIRSAAPSSSPALPARTARSDTGVPEPAPVMAVVTVLDRAVGVGVRVPVALH